MGAFGGGVPGRVRSTERGTVEAQEGPAMPSGEPFGRWLDRRVRGGRLGKDRSGPAISSAHYGVLDDLRRELRTRRGYSPREVSYGNLVKIAIELLREHAFDRGAGQRDDHLTTPGRSERR